MLIGQCKVFNNAILKCNRLRNINIILMEKEYMFGIFRRILIQFENFRSFPSYVFRENSTYFDYQSIMFSNDVNTMFWYSIWCFTSKMN